MLFTRENARLFAARSVASRKIARESAAATPVQPVVANGASNEFLSARAREIDSLLVKLKHDLAHSKDATERVKLAMAIDRLEITFSRYAGIPGPGNLRPSRQRRTLGNGRSSLTGVRVTARASML